VVLGLAVVNAAGFVVGAVVGQVWLRLRLGRVRTAEVLVTVGKTVLAAVPAAGAALGVGSLVDSGSLVDIDGVAGAWIHLLLSTLVVGVVMAGALLALRTGEMHAVVRVLLRRPGPRS